MAFGQSWRECQHLYHLVGHHTGRSVPGWRLSTAHWRYWLQGNAQIESNITLKLKLNCTIEPIWPGLPWHVLAERESARGHTLRGGGHSQWQDRGDHFRCGRIGLILVRVPSPEAILQVLLAPAGDESSRIGCLDTFQRQQDQFEYSGGVAQQFTFGNRQTPFDFKASAQDSNNEVALMEPLHVGSTAAKDCWLIVHWCVSLCSDWIAIVVAHRSNMFLSLPNDGKTSFADNYKNQPLRKMNVITCIATLKKTVSDEYAPSCLIFGTESQDVYILEIDAFTILTTVRQHACFLSVQSCAYRLPCPVCPCSLKPMACTMWSTEFCLLVAMPTFTWSSEAMPAADCAFSSTLTLLA